MLVYAMNEVVSIPFDNRYATLSDRLFSHQKPTPVKAPQLIRVNAMLAEHLGIHADQLANASGVNILAGNEIATGSEPIATVYAGHQFGNWNPQLGDGRAVLLGEVIAADGLRYDIQLKGAGVTPYSRMGDGRSPLGPVLREYLVSEAMHTMGVPSTRALAAVITGEPVYRERALPGAILTRVARSHIRVGTFQYFAAREDWDSLQTLADHVIERHYPTAAEADNPYLTLFEQAAERQAQLIAQWQSLGFIHGVMNTDNMLVGGETVDYGPCAFMESYNPATVFSSIDRQGRYAYTNQPSIAQWNLAWLAQSLLPLIDDDQDQAVAQVRRVLDQFLPRYTAHYQQRMATKLGFATGNDDTPALLLNFLSQLTRHSLDFTLSFRALADYLDSDTATEHSVAALQPFPAEMQPWLSDWRKALEQSGDSREQIQQRLLQTNPVFIPRNHLVEAAIVAGNQGNLTPFHQLADRLQKPFDYDPDDRRFALPARPDEAVTQTFCGT